MPRFLAKLLALVIGASVVAGIVGALSALSVRKKAPPLPDPAADEIELVAIMNGVELASAAPAFRGGRVICWYAGLDLDLRDAALDPAGARLDVRTVFGGTRVVVAPGVPVRVSGPAIFGGTMNSTGSPEPSLGTPGLEITGFTLFGSLQVIASERGEEIPGWTGEHEPGEHEHEDHEHPGPALEVAADVTPA
jgi:hypothetical protein